MILILLLSLILPVPANAGIGDWWFSFCERHLIAADPYQWEHLPMEKVLADYQARGAKAYWAKKLTRVEQSAMRAQGSYLRRARPLMTIDQQNELDRLLEIYQKFEGG